MKNLIHSRKFKLLFTMFLVVAFVLTNTVFAFAASTDKSETLVLKLVGIICYISLLIGVILVIWGVIQLILAIRNEDSDSKTRAIMALVVGIVLISLKFFAEPLVQTMLDSSDVIPEPGT